MYHFIHLWCHTYLPTYLTACGVYRSHLKARLESAGIEIAADRLTTSPDHPVNDHPTSAEDCNYGYLVSRSPDQFFEAIKGHLG